MSTLISLSHFLPKLRGTLKKKVKDGKQEVDILRWMSRTALELIGQSGMGYSFDKLVDDQDDHPYSKSVKKLAYVKCSSRGPQTSI
jgi:hypothetical protein